MTAPAVTLVLPLTDAVLLASAANVLADTYAELYADVCGIVAPETAAELFPEAADMRALADRLLELIGGHDAGR